MEKENKVKLVRIVLSAVLLAAAWALERCTALPMWQLLLVYMVPYLVAGYDVLLESGENIAHGEVFDEDFLMAVATMGALAIGFLPGAENQFPEAVFVMIFFQVGELFEDIAEGRSRRSIAQLMDLRPDTAHVVRSGRELTVAPGEVQVGETLVVKPGEKMPVDGVVLEGRSSLDTVALTGESVPRSVAEGDTVVSGCVNLTGVLKVRAAKAYGESTASKILELVENASSHKSHSESFIARFARVYTPVVVGLALLLAVVPSVVTGQWATWVYRGLVFLVVSCPCALVISVPLTFFSGIGGASRLGVLVKGANYLEALARVGIVVFDKTGTLTKGTFEVTAVHPDKIDERQLLHLAAHVERYSNHPIALSLRNAYPDEADGCKVDDVQEMPGLGVHAMVNGETVNVGNEKLMASLGIEVCHCDKCKSGAGTVIHVAIGNRYAGHIVISDRVKDDAALHAQLMPADKVAQVERLLASKTGHDTLAMVGDGINDAPVLARADLGIAMGAMGSDAAIEAADVVLMDDKPSKIAAGIQVAKRTLHIARENVVFSIGVKAVILLLAALGMAGMALAVFGDVGVLVLAVLNATRALHTGGHAMPAARRRRRRG